MAMGTQPPHEQTHQPMTKKQPKRPNRLPGPAPIVLEGFTLTDNEPSWTPGTRPHRALAALGIGASWDHAAAYAELHRDTPRLWNNRGQTLLAKHESFAAYLDTDPDHESIAYVAFYFAAQRARQAPVTGALEQIDRARRAGDWKAAAHMLKILPGAKEFRPTLEVSGPDGDAIPVEVRAANIAAAARSYQSDDVDDGEDSE